METSPERLESWYYFIKYTGNEEAVNHLADQISKVEFALDDEDEELNLFDIDIENLVSEKTAKEMSRVELNSFTYHRKFDGTLQKIDLGLESYRDNFKRIKKCNRILGECGISEFIDGEDIDEDLKNNDVDEKHHPDIKSNEDTTSSESSSEEEQLSRKEIARRRLVEKIKAKLGKK